MKILTLPAWTCLVKVIKKGYTETFNQDQTHT